MARKRDYYDLLDAGANDHPIDRAVDQLVRQQRVERKIRDLQSSLGRLLGRHRTALLELEELRVGYYARRSAAYFNLGYERGLVAIRTAKHRGSRVQRELAAAIQEETLRADLPAHLKMVLLLETALALTVRQETVLATRRTKRRKTSRPRGAR